MGTLRKLWISAQQHLVLHPLLLQHLRHASQIGLRARPMVAGTVQRPRDPLILLHLQWEATLRVDMLLQLEDPAQHYLVLRLQPRPGRSARQPLPLHALHRK